jgi:hypothetical protein
MAIATASVTAQTAFEQGVGRGARRSASTWCGSPGIGWEVHKPVGPAETSKCADAGRSSAQEEPRLSTFKSARRPVAETGDVDATHTLSRP